MNVKLLIFLLIVPLPALAQGYAGLGSSAKGFDIPHTDYQFDFPADHGPHPNFRIEWWYVTANLTGDDGLEYGIQWTLFRSALKPFEQHGWQSPQIWMGHAAITAPDGHFFEERISRGGIGQAGVTAVPFDAWIDEWRLHGETINSVALTAAGANFAYDLSMQAQGPLVLHGNNGYSIKSAEGQASYYYSQPRYRIQGTLHLPDRDVTVMGEGWLDREWSSQPLAADQDGWDWFSLSFETGEKLMAFRLRGDSQNYTSATWIYADGSSLSLPDGSVTFTPENTNRVAGRDIPTTWQIRLSEKELDIQIKALTAEAWMGTRFEYWEGPVIVTGSHTGRGYLEMTGY
ncbi:MAG: lipocalin-like domain-containing protein [Ruegeria sp.]